jgi:putative OPT family oligopeptide transporter
MAVVPQEYIVHKEDDSKMDDHRTGNDIKEITITALVLGGLLSILMGAANTYLGLKAGMTVSASIPAAVISTAILRGLFRRGTILENNIVQTMASTGESLAAGAIFTIPALLMVGAWQEFKFWPTTLIVMLGGLLGVVFMVPLRRAMIVEREDLIYPEGVACSEVLIAGQEGGRGIRLILAGLGVGAVFKFLVTGLHVIKSVVEGAVGVGRSVVYFGSDMSLALVAVGYIVHLQIASLIFMGGVIGWLIAIPILGGLEPGGIPLETARSLWSTQIRYVGVGAMLVGGLYSIWCVRKGILSGVVALRGFGERTGTESTAERKRTERDMSLGALLTVFLLSVFGTLLFYDYLTGSFGVAVAATVVMVFAAFLFVAVATYIVGLVGSSNSPVSGMTICALLLTAGVLLALGIRGDSAIAATLGVAGVVCCAVCTAGDVSQDLKTGSLVGATPARQQTTEMISVVISAFFFAPVLTLLHNAYGIGTDGPDALAAPQAGLFASLVNGFFGDGALPWTMIGIGAGVGVLLILLNRLLERSNSTFRTHVMPVAVGIYLPLSLSAPIFLGGLLHHIFGRNGGMKNTDQRDPGLLFGSGLIAGEALMGIGLAVPIVLNINMAVSEGHGLVSVLIFSAVIVGYGMLVRHAAKQG